MLNDDLIKALESRDDLIKWGFDFHNSVNAKLEIKPLSFETFMNDMKTLLSRNKFTNFGTRTTTITITIIVLFLILVYIIFKRYT
jgi:hypothetical protein